MKIYLKIVMLFLVFTCMFALVACKGTDEKKETNPTSENNKNEQSNFSEEQKNPEAKPSNEKQQNHRLTQIRKIEHLIKNQLTTLKICLNSQKKEKYLMYHLEPIQGILKKLKKRGGKQIKPNMQGTECTQLLQIKIIVFGFNKGSQVFDVRSYHAELKLITLQEIEKALGKPSSVKENGEDKIYVYKVNNQYELKFVIPKSTGKVDHISVFSPEDSINKMAG